MLYSTVQSANKVCWKNFQKKILQYTYKLQIMSCCYVAMLGSHGGAHDKIVLDTCTVFEVLMGYRYPN